MKYFGQLKLIGVAAAVLVGACSGSSGKGTTGGNGDDSAPGDELPPVNADSFKRNPQAPLSCDNALSTNPNSAQLARLTHQQYVNTMKDLFAGLADDASLPKRQDLADELKEGTFSNNVVGQQGSDAITQDREDAVLKVSGAAIKDLPKLMGCQPKDGSAETSCLETFVDNFGLRAWRRPVTSDEHGALKDLFTEARKSLEFPEAVRTVLGAMLESPQFLYRVQEGTGDTIDGKGKLLSNYELASNLSYLLWNTMPDQVLFDAAKKGELSTTAQLEKQTQRMLADDKARQSVQLFQQEWMHVERLATQERFDVKNKAVFPDYGKAQSDALLNGFNAFLDDSFWEGDHSLTRLMTSSKGFVNDDSAAIYGVSKPGKSDLVAVDLDPMQRKGVLTQPFMMAGWSSDTAQSAILRGAFIMENILCAPSPPPPMNVERKLVTVPDRNAVTLRQVVEMTVEQGSCKGCHQFIDGFGFLFENYDGVGAYQTKERDLPINAMDAVQGTFDLDGPYDNAVKFADALGKSQQAAQCMVQNFYEFATARHPLAEDGCIIAPLTDSFLKNGTDMQQLVIDMVKSPAFRYRSVAQ